MICGGGVVYELSGLPLPLLLVVWCHNHSKTTMSLLVHSRGLGGVVELCESKDLSEFLTKSKSWTDECLQHFFADKTVKQEKIISAQA